MCPAGHDRPPAEGRLLQQGGGSLLRGAEQAVVQVVHAEWKEQAQGIPVCFVIQGIVQVLQQALGCFALAAGLHAQA